MKKYDTIVVLGASNVSRSIETLIRMMNQPDICPLDLLVAAGRGRSYGADSNFFLRQIPGIAQSQLWKNEALAEGKRVAAVITDIGNDIIYGYQAEQIAGFIETSLQRLQGIGADIVLAKIPVQNAKVVTPLKFNILKIVAPPARQRTADEIQSTVFALQDRLDDLAEKYGVTTIEQGAAFYGLDPIHHKLSAWVTVWQSLLRPLLGEVNPEGRFSAKTWVHLQRLRAAEQSLGKKPTGMTQPVLTTDHGLRLSYY